jgi:hypothetical protein
MLIFKSADFDHKLCKSLFTYKVINILNFRILYTCTRNELKITDKPYLRAVMLYFDKRSNVRTCGR